MKRSFIPTLSQNFNMFGPRFQEWLVRMFPLYAGSSKAKKTRDLRQDDTGRAILNRLIALWVALHAPRIEM